MTDHTHPPLAVILPLVLGACMTPTVVPTDPPAHARRLLTRMVQDEELPGAQYVVIDRERVRLNLHVGVRDVASGEPMQASTLLLAYSVTKALTSIAVMQLVDAGKIDLSAPLNRYVADHPYGAEVSVRSLLAHTAGIPNPMPLDWFVLQHEPLDRAGALRKILVEHPERDDAVDTRYRYSNVGYWLLERVIEVASGEDYGDYIAQHVFAPLGVTASALTFDPQPSHALATGHSRRFTLMGVALRLMTPSRYWSSPHGGWSRVAHVKPLGRSYGGIFTSAAALAPVLQDLLQAQPKLLSAHARDQMLTAQHTRDGEPTGEALGWVMGELNGVRYVGKQGGGLGFHGNVRIYPTLGIATVLLANRTEVSAGSIDERSDELDSAFTAAVAMPGT